MSESDPDLEEMKSFYDGVYYADSNKPLQSWRGLRKRMRGFLSWYQMPIS